MNKKEGKFLHLDAIKMLTHHVTLIAAWYTSRYSSCACSYYVVHIMILVMCL
jgi:hypothetical protein